MLRRVGVQARPGAAGAGAAAGARLGRSSLLTWHDRREQAASVGCAAAAKEVQDPQQSTRSRIHTTSTSGSSSPSTSAHAYPATAPGPLDQSTAAHAFVAPTGRQRTEDASGRLILKSLTLPELEQWCMSLGESPKRALQLWRWMYADGSWIRSMQETVGSQNGFSRKFIEAACACSTVDGGLRRHQVLTSKDGTRKMEFKLTEGEGAGSSIETVLIPVVRQSGLRNRITICVSTQVGCAMNCQFCYTGRMGLRGNLSTAQIVEQVVEAKRLMTEQGDNMPITNIVFMGMGEPLHNLEAVLAAIDIMSCNLGLHLSHNKITVSTVGLVPEIREFKSRSRAQLAVSLHATTDEVRDWIVPVNRRHPLGSLMSCLAELFPRQGEAAVLIEYIMLRDVNDTPEDARRLLELIEPINAKVNLIVFNPHAGTKFFPSEMPKVLDFRSILIQGARVCTIRDSRGDDEMAACGQLGNPGAVAKTSPILPPPDKFRAAIAS